MISQFPNGFCLNVLSVFISVSNLGTTGFFSHAAIACGKHFEVTAFHYKVSAAIQTGFHKGGCNKSWLLRLYLCKLMGKLPFANFVFLLLLLAIFLLGLCENPEHILHSEKRKSNNGISF